MSRARDGRRPVPQPEGRRDRAPEGTTALVAGGGLAGIAAACALAERGVAVTVVERESSLGGRLRTWPETLPDGTVVRMERGFHAFFRQYYNLRALLRRIDPGLDRLIELEDYPILGAHGVEQSFAGLPRRTPWNIAALTFRTPSLAARSSVRNGS